MTTPNACVILPAEATGIMKEKGSTWVDGSLDRTHEAYRAMLYASPNSGRVTAEMLEAATIAYDACPTYSVEDGIRAAFEAIGLTVEG